MGPLPRVDVEMLRPPLVGVLAERLRRECPAYRRLRAEPVWDAAWPRIAAAEAPTLHAALRVARARLRVREPVHLHRAPGAPRRGEPEVTEVIAGEDGIRVALRSARCAEASPGEALALVACALGEALAFRGTAHATRRHLDRLLAHRHLTSGQRLRAERLGFLCAVTMDRVALAVVDIEPYVDLLRAHRLGVPARELAEPTSAILASFWYGRIRIAGRFEGTLGFRHRVVMANWFSGTTTCRRLHGRPGGELSVGELDALLACGLELQNPKRPASSSPEPRPSWLRDVPFAETKRRLRDGRDAVRRSMDTLGTAGSFGELASTSVDVAMGAVDGLVDAATGRLGPSRRALPMPDLREDRELELERRFRELEKHEPPDDA